MRMEHIVVASNLSVAARHAYPHAVALARAFGARVTLLHVDELGHGYRDSDGLAEYFATVATVRRDRLNAAQAEFAAMGVEVDVDIVSGLPKAAIAEYVASKESVDCVVMARRNRPGIEDLILGSTTHRVLRLMRVPVLVVPEAGPGGEAAVGDALGPEDVPTYRHLLTPTDLSEASRQGLRASVALADTLDAKITLLHVVRVPTLFPLVAGEQPIGLPRGSLDVLQKRHITSVRKEVQAANSKRIHPLVVMGGSPGDAIVDTADEERVDLIAIPAIGRGALRRVLLGSTAERVARKASRPVFVMPTSWLEQFPL